MTEPVAIRPAASVILWRQAAAGRQVLMGQRGAAAVFMPSKYVFPGGGVDATDHAAGHLSDLCHNRLRLACADDAPRPEALAGCTLRELAEETGFRLPPRAPLQFIFRAITPAGAPRRFDARFFLAEADRTCGDLDDFSAATDELRHLHWIGLTEARHLDLPFVTEVVLAEVAALLAGHVQPGVPFFDNQGPVPVFRRLI
ncbi:MAG: NUDIX hydrolase [Alphaproteobacteria bacterium]|jgi:8-oxo-dGTP pyrophosphatase MutT (NUDIX family)